jgi:hypothetical protein
LVIAAALAGCGKPGDSPESTYFPMPFATSVSSPAVIGDWVDFGAADFQTKGNDTVTLQGAELVGLSGQVDVSVVLLPRTHGGIGIIREADLPSGLNVGSAPPLSVASMTSVSGLSQVLVRMRPKAAGRSSASAVRVTFQVGSGPTQSETFPAAVVICAAPVLPTSCW